MQLTWHGVSGAILDTMRHEGRIDHPARMFVDRLADRWFDGRPFQWLDLGIMGMVDYERLRSRMNFRFTGADISAAVVDDARRYLRSPEDQVLQWDVSTPPPADLLGRFDLVTARHVINHCRYYVDPVRHLAATLRPGGRLVIVMHLALVEGADQLDPRLPDAPPGTVVGNNYGREEFFRNLGDVLAPEFWVRLDDGRKPNDVVVARNGGTPRDIHMERMWVGRGGRQLPRRLASRLWFDMTVRLPR